MKKIWLKNKMIIVVAGYAVLIGGLFSWFFLPAVRHIKNESDEIQKRSLDGEINQKRIIKIKDLEKDVEDLRNNEGKIDVFVGSDQEVGFIEQLENLAEKTKNEVTFKVDDQAINKNSQAQAKTPPTSGEPEEKNILDSLAYKKFFSLQISLKGNNQSVFNFIKGLENFSKYSNVVGLNLSLVEENLDGSAVSSNIFSYSLPSAGQASSLSKPRTIKKISALIDLVVYTK